MGRPELAVIVLDRDQDMLDLWAYLFETLGITDFAMPRAERPQRRASERVVVTVGETDQVLLFSPKGATHIPGLISLLELPPIQSGRTVCVFGPTHELLDWGMLGEHVDHTRRLFNTVYIPSANTTELHAPMAGAIALWHLMQTAHG
jgi:hypothetical protein